MLALWGHKTISLGFSSKGYKRFNPKVAIRLIKLFKKYEVSLVLVQRYKILVYAFLAKFFLGRLIIVYHVQSTRTLRNFHRKLIFGCMYSHLDKIVVNSQGVKKDLITSAFKIDPLNIEVIYNGINIEKFCPNISKAEARRYFELPEKGFIFGMAARFKKAKDQEGLIKAFAEIKKRGAKAVLALAGSGPKEQGLRVLINDLGLSDSIRILNWIPSPEIPIFLKALDVFAHPSWREGMPTAVMEAMAAGLPVVTTNAEGVPELFDTPRKFGFMVERGDLSGLTEALWRTYKISPEERLRMGQEARARIKEAFSHEHMGRRFVELFDSLFRKVEQG